MSEQDKPSEWAIYISVLLALIFAFIGMLASVDNAHSLDLIKKHLGIESTTKGERGG